MKLAVTKLAIATAMLVGSSWILTTIATAQTRKKPYEGYKVTVTETSVNPHKVRIIDGRQKLYDGSTGDLNFVFQCNADLYSCRALVVGRTYKLYSGDGSYRCDDYTLASGTNYDFAYVCLDDVQ